MKRYMTTKRRARGGFTLVEMLLVLFILGTLAAIVIPKLAGRSEEAREIAAQTQIKNFSTALDSFEIDNGYYPDGDDGLEDLIEEPKDANNWHGPYLDSIPKDPWGIEYNYEYPGKHKKSGYDLSSNGPDERANTKDDITNWDTDK